MCHLYYYSISNPNSLAEYVALTPFSGWAKLRFWKWMKHAKVSQGTQVQDLLSQEPGFLACIPLFSCKASKPVIAPRARATEKRGARQVSSCPSQDLPPLCGEIQPQEEDFYPRGCSNSRRLSASSVSAKTQQIINYDFSPMVSHIPLQARLCPEREEHFSAAESGLHFWLDARLSARKLLTRH